MKKFFTLILTAIMLLPLFAGAQHKIIMSFWADTNDYSYYPVPGSLTLHHQINSNPDFRDKLNFINVISYSSFAVDYDGYIHFKDSYHDLSLIDKMGFCQTHEEICSDLHERINPGLGSFSAFVRLQNYTNTLLKIISIGGANSEIYFDNAIRHPENFISSIAETINYYHLAGVDLDFELNTSFSSAQAEAYAKLVTSLRKKLGPLSLITVEVDPNVTKQNSIGLINWQVISNNANYIILMGYEFHSFLYQPYITGYNSNLYTDINEPGTRFHPSSDDISIHNLLNLGIPSHKIILGIPAYGHTYGGVSNKNNGLFQTFSPEITPRFDAFGKGTITYSTVLKLLNSNFHSHESYYNGFISAIYAYNNKTKQFITYENSASIKAKAHYVIANNLAGAMLWNIAEDAPARNNQSLLVSLYYALNSGFI